MTVSIIFFQGILLTAFTQIGLGTTEDLKYTMAIFSGETDFVILVRVLKFCIFYLLLSY